MDPARVPDHPVEEIGHAQEAATGVSRGADQQPQQRQPRGGTCGELGVGRGRGGGVVARPGPARPARPPPSPARPAARARTMTPRSPLPGWDGPALPRRPLYIYMPGGDGEWRETFPVMTGPSLT